MDYINTSHPNFVGGSKAVELANQQIKNSRVPLPISRSKVGPLLVVISMVVLLLFNPNDP